MLCQMKASPSGLMFQGVPETACQIFPMIRIKASLLDYRCRMDTAGLVQAEAISEGSYIGIQHHNGLRRITDALGADQPVYRRVSDNNKQVVGELTLGI